MSGSINLARFQARIANLQVLAAKKEITPRQLYHEIKVAQGELDSALGIRTMTSAQRCPNFVIKSITRTGQVTREVRQAELIRTGYNVFNIKAFSIFIDLLTDSGTGALSDEGWAAIMTADERYAHSTTYHAFLPVAQEIFNKQFILPVHQGRAAEKVVFPCLLNSLVAQAQAKGKQVVCLGNTYFDTTFALASATGAKVINTVCPESQDTNAYFPFKGNADIEAMAEMIKEHGAENVGFVIMTVVNNTIGGQPVSLANLKATHALAKEHNILFILDAARIFENAYLIQQREPGYQNKTIQEIVHEMTELADVVLMSAKKDAIANMGGLIATNNEDLYNLFQGPTILTEGHFTYGGMSGRDLAALTVGLKEGMEQEYLRARVNQVEEFGNGFRRLGFPIQWPAGSNGIYLDARGFMGDLDPLFFPGQRLCTEIYLRFGIRPVEIGLSLAGRDNMGIKVVPNMDLVRFTIPRRVLSGDHMAFILDRLGELHDAREEIGGLVYEKEGLGNGHFTSTFKPVSREEIPGLRPGVIEYFNTPRNTYSVNYLPPNAQ